jgi:hypothetical protein
MFGVVDFEEEEEAVLNAILALESVSCFGNIDIRRDRSCILRLFFSYCLVSVFVEIEIEIEIEKNLGRFWVVVFFTLFSLVDLTILFYCNYKFLCACFQI